jgi:prepilin-type N-terminal cleavage/methylation domain-containing protein
MKFKSASRLLGFTLVEVMMTLIIVVILTGLGFMSMGGYLPKQRLISTARFVESALMRAQSEAYSRSAIVGMHFKDVAGKTVGEVFIDDGSCAQDSGEAALTNVQFRDGVNLTTSPCLGVYAGATGCTTVPDCYLFFDNAGQAVTCTPGPLPTPPTLTPIDYEIVVYSNQLDTTAPNTREIEVLSSGLVQVIKLGQTGNSSGGNSAAACVQ